MSFARAARRRANRVLFTPYNRRQAPYPPDDKYGHSTLKWHRGAARFGAHWYPTRRVQRAVYR